MTFIKRIAGAAFGALLLGSGLIASPAQAAYILKLEQVGSNVVATGSGSIDTIGLNGPNLDIVSTFMQPFFGEIYTGPLADQVLDSNYSGGIGGPISFGNGTNPLIPDSGSGDIVGISGIDKRLNVPSGYVSGHLLSSTSTWLNQTLATLGATPGSYTWQWGGIGDTDTFTIIVGGFGSPGPGPLPVPEPASAALLGAALAGLLLAGTIRRLRHL